MALAGAGQFLTGPLTLHTTTNIEIIKKFLPIDVEVSVVNERQNLVKVHA